MRININTGHQWRHTLVNIVLSL